MSDGNGQTDNPFGGLAASGGGAPSPERLAKFEMNDIGHAMRLILLSGGEIDDDGEVDITRCRLLWQIGAGWVGFNGRFWDKECGEDEARKAAHRTARAIRGLYDIIVGERKQMSAKDFFKIADQAGSAGATSAMLKQAQSYLTVRIDVFDRDPLAINCRNGTLKMRFDPKAEAGKRFGWRLGEHDPADRITRMAAVTHDASATCPEFMRVLETSLPDKGDGVDGYPDSGMLERRFFHRWCGYSATGRTEEQAFTLTQGRGRDGKSTLLDACREAMGTYGWACAPATFLEGGIRSGSDASPDLVALSGDTRFVVLSEPSRGSKLNEGLLKAWTGGAPIVARDLHGKPFNFRPRGKLSFECNAFPVARGDDDGIWRRVLTPQFRHQVPEDKIDRLIPDRLRDNELPGILNWLVAGVGDWLERGSLDMPASLKSVAEDYRRSSSPFGDWLRERCVTGEDAKGARTLSGDLYRDFKAWFDAQGFEKPMSARAFGDALRDRQIGLMGKDRTGLKYRGPIRLKTEAEGAADSAADDANRPGASGPGGAPAGDPVDAIEPPSDDIWDAADDEGTPFG